MRDLSNLECGGVVIRESLFAVELVDVAEKAIADAAITRHPTVAVRRLAVG